jgi:hypothetical protein
MQRNPIAADRPSLGSDMQEFKTESADDLPSSAVRAWYGGDYGDSRSTVKQIADRRPRCAQRPAAFA